VQAILQLRDEHPAWGGRKLRRRLQDLGHQDVPAASTVSGILLRHGRISEEASRKSQAFIRFEKAAPNDLWGMDFKGHFPLSSGGRCHPLTILDDHSRYSIGLRALDNERGESVQTELTGVFRRYGLPAAMLMDNGPPWGDTHCEGSPSWLSVWLMELGIRVLHTRPAHPQTNGKDERFHRTLKLEVLQGNSFCDVRQAQDRFDPFRECYNHQRPHQALEMNVPASRYQASQRSFPETIAEWEYAPDVTVRKVDQTTGAISWQGQRWKIGRALKGRLVGIRATTTDGQFDVYFRNTKIKTIDLGAREEG
jgi:transposase InsO family protein